MAQRRLRHARALRSPPEMELLGDHGERLHPNGVDGNGPTSATPRTIRTRRSTKPPRDNDPATATVERRSRSLICATARCWSHQAGDEASSTRSDTAGTVAKH